MKIIIFFCSFYELKSDCYYLFFFTKKKKKEERKQWMEHTNLIFFLKKEKLTDTGIVPADRNVYK